MSNTEIDGQHAGTAGLSLGALGVVYGDIGTSPIYALRETVRAAAGGGVPEERHVIGALSIITWAIVFVVAVKYAIFVLRADNKGEGGTLSIMTLARAVSTGRQKGLIVLLGVVGAALFLGDAIITPAISVLSAVEGLHVAAPAIGDFVVPFTVVIIVTLFSVQRFGTGAVAKIFGPVMLIWFLALGGSGLFHLADDLRVFQALNPFEAVWFVSDNWGVALVVIGASFLAVTGAEALYVDLGHFGKKPILIAWFGLVFPCLLLNYFGQGAYLLSAGGKVEQPLFQMAPSALVLPMVLLATVATVIASQAVITGAFSLVRQAIQLRLLPRLDIVHTSEDQEGRIFLPQVNRIMLLGVLLLVVGFGSSESLSAAYGISVSGEMLVTTILLAVVMYAKWRWPLVLVIAIAAAFIFVDVLFVVANATKIMEGGWVTIIIALLLVLIMRTWQQGSAIIFRKTRRAEVPLGDVIDMLEAKPPHVISGTALFLTGDPQSAPTSLMHSLKHFQVLHKHNVIVHIETIQMPKVPETDRVRLKEISPHFSQMSLRFGYMEDPNVPRALALARKQGFKFDIMRTTFFLSRRSLIPASNPEMPRWQEKLYISLTRNAVDATNFFRLPTGRVVEIGTQVLF